MSQDPILEFFRGTGTDHAGRRHAEIVTWPDHRLETVHDYIQWLFPLRRRSAFNPNAPVLTPETIEAFWWDTDLREALLAGLRRMVSFYGFDIRSFADGEMQLDPVQDFAVRSRSWLTAGNHNFLRLTRILTSLRTLGCQDEAEALFDVLDLVYQRNRTLIGDRTFGFWSSAVRRH